MKKAILFLSLLIVNLFAAANCQLLIASVRYVSHSGSNTPPYLTWETAADSIMSAINISSFGDTIYVANGVYDEQVVMIPGLSLIGAGMDSCIIDTRALVNSIDFVSATVSSNCLFKGFRVLTYYNSDKGYGITGGENSLVMFNNFNTAGIGAYIGSNPTIYNNIFTNVTIGIWGFNSNSTIRKNLIYPGPNSIATILAGIYIEAFDLSYTSIIDSNYIYLINGSTGIRKEFGSRIVIKNNLIKTVSNSKGISIGYTDSAIVANNFIIGEEGGGGITDGFRQYIFNNAAVNLTVGFEVSGTVKNNLVINSGTGIVQYGNPTIQYNDSWNNIHNFSGFTPDSTNLSVNPMVINEDTSNGGPDFHLQAYSPLIDRGDPNILGKDGSRSDIGLYGGPFGESYRYLDLPPRTPVNFTAVLDTEYIKLTWNRNTESDLSNYNLYRDTVQGFPIDSSTLVASLKDTFYLQVIPPGIDNFYFRVTAVDNQGNESEPSEERHIEIVSVKDRPKIFSNYQLYQNYSNPFNPSTKIGYRLKERGYVKLYVYDIKGELVETLVNKYQNKGYYEVEFNGEVHSQQSAVGKETNILASGIYIYQIMVRNENSIPVYSDIKKMVLLK